MERNVTSRIVAILVGNTMLRIAGSSGGALIAFYMAHLALQGHPVDATVIGLLGVVLNLAELFGAVPVGVASDRFTPRAVLIGGALLGGVATLMFGLSQAIAVFFFARAIQGVVAVVGGPPLLALITEATRENPGARNRVVGFYELSLLSGVALGALVGGLMWEAFGVLAFSLLAVLYLAIAAIFAWGARLPGQARGEHGPIEGLRHALANPTLLKLAPAWLAINAVIGLWLTNVSYQLTASRVPGQALSGGFTPGQVGLIMLVYALLFAGGITGWTFLLGRVSRVQTMRISLSALLVTCAALYALNAHELPAPLAWLIVAVGAVSVVVESGFTPAALAYLASLADESSARGSTMGVYTLLLGLGNAIGAGLGGWLAHLMGFNGLIVGTIGLVALALAAVSRLPHLSPAHQEAPHLAPAPAPAAD